MSKVKLLAFILVTAGIVFGGLWYLDRSLRESPNAIVADVTKYEADGITWYQDRSKTFTMAVFKGAFDLSFATGEAQSLKEQALAKHYALAANAGYFKGTHLDAEHVGLLMINGQVLQPLVNDSQKQLTQVAVLNKETGTLNFVTTRNLDVGSLQRSQINALQSGPLILKDSVVQFTEINDSLNGSGRFARTVLGYTDTGENFIFISRVSLSLDILAGKLLKMEAFECKKISALNLDGGSSTAIYSSQFTDVNFGESKRLPAVIGVIKRN